MDGRFQEMRSEFAKEMSMLGVTFENTVTAAMRKQDKQMAESFADLKAMFLTGQVPTPSKKVKLTPRQDFESSNDDENL